MVPMTIMNIHELRQSGLIKERSCPGDELRYDHMISFLDDGKEMQLIRGIAGFCCINNPCKETFMKCLGGIWEKAATASSPSQMHSSLFVFLYPRGCFSFFFFLLLLHIWTKMWSEIIDCNRRKPLRNTEMTIKWHQTKDANQLINIQRMTNNGCKISGKQWQIETTSTLHRPPKIN